MLRSVIAMMRQRKWRCLWQALLPMSATITRQLHKLQSLQYSCSLRNGGDMRQLSLPLCPLCGPLPPPMIMPMSRPLHTKPQLCRQQPCQNHRPCCLPPPTLHHHIWAQSSIPMGGGIHRRIRHRLPWRLQHHFPSSQTNNFGSATAPDLVIALDVATVLALSALLMRCFPHPLYQHRGEGYRCMPSTTNRRSDVIGLVTAMVAVINLACLTRLVMRLFPPTLIQHWGGLQRCL